MCYSVSHRLLSEHSGDLSVSHVMSSVYVQYYMQSTALTFYYYSYLSMQKDKSVNLGDKGCVNRAEPARGRVLVLLPHCAEPRLAVPGARGGGIANPKTQPHPAARWDPWPSPPVPPNKTNPLDVSIPHRHTASSREDGATNSLLTTYGRARVTY